MRIASLLPSATDIAAALGLEDQLIAISHCCDRPEHLMHLPRLTRSIVDSGRAPDEIDRAVSLAVREGRPLYQVDGNLLEALQPDLIVTQGVCEVCAVSPKTLEETVKYLPEAVSKDAQILTLSGENLHGILADVYAFGKATNRIAQANALIERAQSDWNALEAVSHAPKVMTLEWAEPPFCGGHWVPEQVVRAGGVNTVGNEGEPSTRTTWAAVIEADPDIIIVMCCGYGLIENVRFARGLLDHPQARELRAVRQGRVWVVDANGYFSRPSLEIVRGAFVLREAFLGRAVSGASERVTAVPA